MSFTLVRGALVLTALVAGAWLVLGFRANELHADGVAVLDQARAGAIESAEIEDGLSLLERARRWNADTRPQVDEALLLTTTGRRRSASAVLTQVLADEPDNFEAWVVAYLTARASRDRVGAARAFRRVGGLNPLLGRTLPPPASGS